MFETKKTLIVVYKDEMLMNQLKKLVETRDDGDEGVVGTRDDSINIVSWTEKVWIGNKSAGNIKGKILFLGDIKGTDKLIPVLDIKFDDCGVKYGWAGNQAVLFADTKKLADRKEYDAFLKKLADLPVPGFLKKTKENVVSTGTDSELEKAEDANALVEDKEHAKPKLLQMAQKAIVTGAETMGKVGSQVAVKTEEVFRNKLLMKKQMLFYGVVHLYNDGLETFMNL